MSDVSILLRPYDGEVQLKALRTAGLAVHRADGSWSQTEPFSMPLVTTHTARG
jgi:phosphohistidine phosphatase